MQRIFILFVLLGVVYCENEDSPPGDEFFSEVKKLGKDCFDIDSCTELTTYHKDDRSGFAECKKEKKYTENILKYKEIECVAECWGHKADLITGKTFNDNLKTTAKKRLGHHEWLTPLFDKIVEGCVNLDISPKDPNKCCGNVVKMGWCIVAQVMLQTPEKEQRDPKQCAILQGYLKKYHTLPQQKLWCHKIHPK